MDELLNSMNEDDATEMEPKRLEWCESRTWISIKVRHTDEKSSELKPYYLKLCCSDDSYTLLITNLLTVWWRHSTTEAIMEEWQENNPSMKQVETRKIVAILEDLLCKEQGSSSPRTHQAIINEDNNLILSSTMEIASYEFNWSFTCTPYGNQDQQAKILREQMYFPLHEMVKMLTFKLGRSSSSNNLNSDYDNGGRLGILGEEVGVEVLRGKIQI